MLNIPATIWPNTGIYATPTFFSAYHGMHLDTPHWSYMDIIYLYYKLTLLMI